MTKTSTISTRSADGFRPLGEVIVEDAQAVAEQLNWSAGNRPVTHAALAVGPVGWGDALTLGTLSLKFPASSGWNRCLVFKIIVSADTQSITVGAQCYVSAGTCDLRVTIGSSAATSVGSFTSSDNGTEKTCSIATSSSGTGELTVTVERNHSSGSATDCYVRNFRVEDAPIAATDLPDPVDT